MAPVIIIRIVVACLVSYFSITKVCGQKDSLKYKGINARLHYGFIIAHSEAVQNTAGAHPYGLELEFYKQRTDTAVWDLCHCYPSKGFSVSYFNFDNTILGHGMTAAYFLEPSYRLNKKMQFRFRGSGGISYLTNPYNKESNPGNMSYSTRISGFLQAGLGTTYQLKKNILLQAGVQYQHISNGGLKEPNKGINWPTASVGVSYYPANYALPFYRKRVDRFTGGKKVYLEAGIIFSAKQGFKDEKRARTPLVGLLLQAAKQVGRTNALNFGLEVYHDNALRQQLQKDNLDKSPVRAGVLAGHDFLLGKIFFSQQLGVYVFQQTPYFNKLYHRWAFRYQINEKWLAGLALKAHKQVADFIDVRIMYRIR